MERGFYNEDLEQLIKQKADQYRMYPSDKVWKGIFRTLHTRRKWYWLSFVLFITGIGYYAVTQLNAPSAPKQVATNTPTTASGSPEHNNEDSKAIIVPFTTSRQNKPRTDASTRHTFLLKPEAEVQIAVAGSEPAGISKEAPVYDLQTRRMREDLKPSPDDKISLITNNENLPSSFITGAVVSDPIEGKDEIELASNKVSLRDELANEDIK